MKTRNKKFLLFFIIIFLICFALTGGSSFADVGEEEVAPREVKPIPFLVTTPKFLKDLKVKSFLSITEGFDNNVHLNTTRKKDAFTQIYYRATHRAPIDKNTNRILEFSLMNLSYTDASSVNLVTPKLLLGLESKLSKDLKLSANYSFGITDYINHGNDDFSSHRLNLKLRQNLPLKLSHYLSYEFMYKNYVERRTRESATVNADNVRADLRNTIEYAIAKRFPTDQVKLSFEFFDNDSNDKYLDYYDFHSYKPQISFIHLFSKKIFGYASFSRQYRHYLDRSIINDPNAKQQDTLDTATQSLYYKASKDLTLGLSHTYRRNESREPTAKYSGSVIQVSCNYTF